MLHLVLGLLSIVCLTRAAPTVHLGEHVTDNYDYNTELPLIIDPIVVTTKPLTETSYVNPINMNYVPPITPTVRQPVHQQPQPQLQPQSQPQQPQFQYYYFQPTHLHPYQPQPSYQMQPSFGYQWQDSISQQQLPVLQPKNTNVLPCANSRHYGGYQQYGY